MKAKHAKTLITVFRKPTQGGIIFADIESLITGLGGEVREGAGSRIAFEMNGSRRYFHRPHPGKKAKKYQVEELRGWLTEMGIQP